MQRIRHVVEKPSAGAAAATATTSNATNAGTSTEPFSVLASCAKALNRLGEVQQQQAEKLTQFVTVVRRDVVLRPLDDMVATYDERSAAMLVDGQRLDSLLYDAQRSVVDAFTKFDAMYRDMERDRGASGESAKPQDLWLAEIAYSVHVHRLQQTRVEYVKGMSALFQQYKTLEVMRVSVLQTALDTYIRKQKLLYDELAGGMSEPMAAVQVRHCVICCDIRIHNCNNLLVFVPPAHGPRARLARERPENTQERTYALSIPLSCINH